MTSLLTVGFDRAGNAWELGLTVSFPNFGDCRSVFGNVVQHGLSRLISVLGDNKLLFSKLTLVLLLNSRVAVSLE